MPAAPRKPATKPGLTKRHPGWKTFIALLEEKAKARSKTGRKPRGRVIAATNRQTGRSNLTRDRQRKAMQPGKRRSASGRIYYETRKNRSDLRGSRV